MLVKSIAALAALSFAASVAAEPVFFKPTMVKTSARSLFGIVRRDENPGYQPEQAMCNNGNTCAEACGGGYETCSSGDGEVHCFNPTAGERCCPNKSGSSCEADYYCTADTKGETWCCPDGMDLAACAEAYDVEGELVSQTPPPATSTAVPTTATTATPEPITTTAAASSTSTEEEEEEETSTEEAESSTANSSFAPSSTYVRPNSTAVTTVQTPQPTETEVQEAGAGVTGPAAALVLLAAGFAALL
jgi:hypothetical protein